jgi:hypothetical protein
MDVDFGRVLLGVGEYASRQELAQDVDLDRERNLSVQHTQPEDVHQERVLSVRAAELGHVGVLFVAEGA